MILPSRRFHFSLLCFVGPWCAFASPATALEKVVLQLKWRHQFQFAGYYAAIQQGYYRDAGLEVELREAEPGQDPARELTEGRADFGVGTSNLILLRSKGVPVVVLGVIYQHSPFVLISTAESGVRDVQDLATRPIMMEPDAAEILAYFKNEGVDVAKMKILPHSFDLNDLIHRKVDGMACYSTDEPLHLKEKGIEFSLFNPRAGGIDFYGDNLFTIEKQIEEHPERVKAFLRASLRGWSYAMQHREEIIELIRRDYSRGKSYEQLVFEADETAKLVHPELIEVGYINPGRWDSIARTYEDLGMMTGKVRLKDFIYDRNPQRDLRWLYWLLLGAAALVAGSFGWSLLTARMNRLLRIEVAARKLAEERARSENAAKTRFLSILAHEVRTPLSGILSALWLYRGSKSQEERDQVVEIAETSSSQLLRLVDHTLDHSKLEGEQMEVEILPVEVADFLLEITGLFKGAAATKSISLRAHIDPALPAVIFTDPMRLRQILSNLISNAVKFTSEGGVQVTATANSTGSTTIFQVSDTGPGVMPEVAARIFEPYVQADASISRKYGGTGLGLAISSQLATLLGGEIRVESGLGQGATFVLTLPNPAL